MLTGLQRYQSGQECRNVSILPVTDWLSRWWIEACDSIWAMVYYICKERHGRRYGYSVPHKEFNGIKCRLYYHEIRLGNLQRADLPDQCF